jgi:hypothetical protein
MAAMSDDEFDAYMQQLEAHLEANVCRKTPTGIDVRCTLAKGHTGQHVSAGDQWIGRWHDGDTKAVWEERPRWSKMFS